MLFTLCLTDYMYTLYFFILSSEITYQCNVLLFFSAITVKLLFNIQYCGYNLAKYAQQFLTLDVSSGIFTTYIAKKDMYMILNSYAE